MKVHAGITLMMGYSRVLQGPTDIRMLIEVPHALGGVCLNEGCVGSMGGLVKDILKVAKCLEAGGSRFAVVEA